MNRKVNVSRFVVASFCMIIVLSVPLIQSVIAESGDFFLGSETMSEEIWSSSTPQHVTVTVSVTGSMADAYADTSPASVTVSTGNQEITMHNGDTETLEDASTDSIWLYENAGYDHNYHFYYGISGNWEVTVLGSGIGGGGNDVLGTGGGVDWVIWGAVAAVIIVLAAIVIILLIKRRPAKSGIPPPPPPPP